MTFIRKSPERFWHIQINHQGSFQGTTSSHFSEAQTQSGGKDILLVFEKRRQQLLKQAYDTMHNYIYKDDSLILSKAAKIAQEDELFQVVFNLVVILLVIASKSLCQQISNI